jgi:hypothetical protein
MGTFPVYVNVPLIGTDLILAKIHEDKVNPRVAGENYGFMAKLIVPSIADVRILHHCAYSMVTFYGFLSFSLIGL